jgi:alkanesulfonate monooxygenase SsuD/methylene tetrahydromethanopterin reductase-like flavin-dependent oxidoreductase (luciferase family)
MNDIGLSINASRETSDDELIAIAKQADDLGYHSFWAAESWGRDAFTVLTMIACHTENIRLATGIINVYSRTPALIAQTIGSLDILSKGRARWAAVARPSLRVGTESLSSRPWRGPASILR